MFKVQISPECIQSVRQNRTDYLTGVGRGRCPADVKAVFPVTMECIKYDRFKASKIRCGFIDIIGYECGGIVILVAHVTI